MPPQMMDRDNPSPRCPAKIRTALGCTVVLILCACSIAAQSRIIRPQPSGNSNSSAKRQRVATLRASDSPDGSRVALSSDQSLNDYEAYRRGDRFYVKIPPADVPRAEIVRGRAFADVKVNRSADSTVVSFRLQPGATARVEQRGNKLDVVFKMPGTGSSAANPNARNVARNDAGPVPPDDQRRRPASNSNTSAPTNSPRTSANRNSADRAASAKASPSPSPKPTPSPTAKPSPTAQTSPVAKGSPVIAQQRSSPTPGNQLTPSQGAQGTTWNKMKARARYLILMAQLNPIPVVIGIAVLVLLIGLFGLFVFQRRRMKATRRAGPRKEKTKAPLVAGAAATSKASASEAAVELAKPIEAGAAVAGAAAVTSLAAAGASEEPPVDGPRNERVARVSDEVKKIMAGGDYDESVIGSEDKDTRQLVGAELLSALVGRNLQRRERARAAFMKHGYFDDATRDLRTAESANERAAAARRLSFVHDREATPHLIGGLDDPSPDVRRASVEALMDLRDPAAISPLNSLMQTEADRKVPRTLIKHAIEACATGGADDEPSPRAATTPDVISQPAETEREVIEI